MAYKHNEHVLKHFQKKKKKIKYVR